MKPEEAAAVRAFYQSLAGSSGVFTQEQVDFYLKVLKGDDASRKAWVATNAEKMGLSPTVVLILQNMGSLNKNELAVIAGTQIGAFLAPTIQKIVVWLWSKIKFWGK